MMCKEVIVA